MTLYNKFNPMKAKKKYMYSQYREIYEKLENGDKWQALYDAKKTKNKKLIQRVQQLIDE